MAEIDSRARSPLRFIVTFLIVVVLPLAIGLYIAPRIVPEPRVGIIRLTGDIFSDSARAITEQLDYARNDASIKAVVLVLNSPGGDGTFSEELYLDVLSTRDEMPVVANIDIMAASGAYYMAAATDKIYAKPTSVVGGIGVIAFLPGPIAIQDEVLTTGPYKGFGGTRDSTVRQIERAKFSFLEAVVTGRRENLKVDTQFLSRGETFSGLKALEYGLIDGLRSSSEAIEEAAALAGLSNYEVVELYPLTFDEEEGSLTTYQAPPIDVQQLWAAPSNLPPGLYYRYIELPSNQ